MKIFITLALVLTASITHAQCTLNFSGSPDLLPVLSQSLAEKNYVLSLSPRSDLSLDVGLAHEGDVGLYAYANLADKDGNFIRGIEVLESDENGEESLELRALKTILKDIEICK